MKRSLKISLAIAILLGIGFVIPERIVIPVQGASVNDWNATTFWYEPWGSSGVHKGIDIFGAQATPVLSTTHGIVLFSGELARGGKALLVLGPGWRLHYYAHLHSIDTSLFQLVKSGDTIATLGDSGNAKGKPPHLHYSIIRMIPLPWAMDLSTQGYKKAFFIDPGKYLISGI